MPNLNHCIVCDKPTRSKRTIHEKCREPTTTKKLVKKAFKLPKKKPSKGKKYLGDLRIGTEFIVSNLRGILLAKGIGSAQVIYLSFVEEYPDMDFSILGKSNISLNTEVEVINDKNKDGN